MMAASGSDEYEAGLRVKTKGTNQIVKNLEKNIDSMYVIENAEDGRDAYSEHVEPPAAGSHV